MPSNKNRFISEMPVQYADRVAAFPLEKRWASASYSSSSASLNAPCLFTQPERLVETDTSGDW